MRRLKHILLVAPCTAAVSIVASGDALASGLSTARFGGEHGHPTAGNPTAIYYNPGAIGLSKGINIYVDGNLALRWASFEHEETCPVPAGAGATPQQCDSGEFSETSDAVGANTSKAGLFNVAAAPFLGATAVIPAGDTIDIGVGAAFFVPFGGQSTWSKNEAFQDHPRFPGPYDGSQRWWSIDGTLRALFISLGASVSIDDLVHIGVSGGPAINEVNTIRAKTLANDNNIGAEGRAWIDAKDLNVHLGGGIAVTPFRNDELRLGFSYQMPVGFGAITMQGPLSIHDGFGGVTESEVDVHHVWPDVFRLGVAYKPMKELELRLFGDVTRWNLFEDQCIAEVGLDTCRNDAGELNPEVIINLPRRWNVGVGVRAGASYWFADWVEGFFGLGYDSNAVPDDTLEPALLDFHDISVAAGAKLWATDWFGIVGSYTHLFYVPRDTNGDNTLAQETGNSLGPDAGGKYTQTIGVFNLGLHFAFDPFASEPAAAGENGVEPGVETNVETNVDAGP